MKKKILIFSDCFIYSGSEVVIENILKSELIEKHFDLSFIYGYNRNYDKRLRERMKYLGISENKFSSVNLLSPDILTKAINYHQKKLSFNFIYLSIAYILLRSMKFLCISHIINYFTLNYRFKRASPDIIYINNGGYPASLQCIIAVFVAHALNIKAIYFNINNMAMHRSKWYHKYIDTYINKYVTKFITASYAAQEQAIYARNFSRGSFIRIPNTIFNDYLISNKYSIESESKTFRFGSVGLLTERKGYHVLIKAVELLVYQHKLTNFELQIIGEGEEKHNLEKLVRSCKLENYVNFLNYQSKPLDYVVEFDVFVLPSIKNEDFPYVILEAMILGKPVIGTRVAGIPEQIDHEINGLLVTPNNSDELADAMLCLLKRKDLKVIGLNSKLKYFNEFSYQKIENEYNSLFLKSL